LANNENNKISIYIKNSKELKSKKRDVQINSTTSDSKRVKNFLKNIKNNKKNIPENMNRDSQIATKDLVKRNRWFVKKPFQKSFNKISNIKRTAPPKSNIPKDKNISLMASKFSIARARETGLVKPEIIFSDDSSRNAKILTKTLTKSAGPVKSGPVYSEDSGRLAMDISKTRARETGTKKPKIIYSDNISREAFKLSFKKNKYKKKIKQNYFGQRYSGEFLRSMSKKSPKKLTLIKTPNNIKKSN
tara:strand:+ start:410 stop:1147 length:738 start_codon:yes stop_codon:yes gene_type:complete